MISTKGRYALRVMIALAENKNGTLVPLKDIAEEQGISKKYLEIIVSALVKAKMIKGSSGKGGGYTLCRKAEDYSVGEILEATEGTLATVACLAEDKEPCPFSSKCKTLPLWTELDSIIHNFLFSKKLSDLIEK